MNFIPLCAKVKSTNPEFHTFLCNSQIYLPGVSYLPVQKSNLPSASFMPLCAIVKSTIPQFHTCLCNSQIYHPRVSCLSMQQSNLQYLSFIPLCAKVKSTNPEFHTFLCNSQNYHPRVSYLPVQKSNKSTIPVFQASLCNSQNYEGQSKITEPYLITFKSSKMEIYKMIFHCSFNVICSITSFISVGRLCIPVARPQNMNCRTGAFTL